MYVYGRPLLRDNSILYRILYVYGRPLLRYFGLPDLFLFGGVLIFFAAMVLKASIQLRRNQFLGSICMVR